MSRLPVSDEGPLAFHPVVLAAVYVVQAAISNSLGPASFTRPLLVAMGTAMLVAVALWLVLRDQPMAALLTSALILALVSHDPVIELLTLIRDASGVGWAVAAMGLIGFAAVAGVVVAIDQFRRGRLRSPAIRSVTRGLNIFSVALLVVVSVPAIELVPAWFDSRPDDSRLGARDEQHPDIYLFLLDGYSRADELERQFGIDNAAFVDQLETRGFAVDPGSRTNYTYTALTLTGLLSMDYVPIEATGVISEVELRDQLHDAMTHGAAFTALRGAGYELVATAPGWEQVAMRPGVDRYLDRPELNDFEMTLLKRTWIPDLPPIPSDWFFRSLRGRITGVLEDAASLASEERSTPAFAFVHVPAPHLPLAFGASGEPVPYSSRQYLAGKPSEFGLSEAEYAAAYAANLAYLNSEVLKTVDSILVASAQPPVIVIMSDHGYNGDSPIHTEAMLRSLFAALTPGRPGMLRESPTPVNLMRVLLDGYMGVDPGRPLTQRYFTTVITGNVRGYDLALTEVDDP